MFTTSMSVRSGRSVVVAVAFAALVWIGVGAATGKAAPSAAKTVWQYRTATVEPSAMQATLDDLGRDGWEVFNVYGAANLSNEGGNLRLVPHTFYVFAKRPL